MLIKIERRHTIRFTFQAPSTLAAHLPQVTSLPIISGPQLTQLLVDEFERSLLGRLCSIGNEVCGEGINATWFVDEMSCRCVGRWEGCLLYDLSLPISPFRIVADYPSEYFVFSVLTGLRLGWIAMLSR